MGRRVARRTARRTSRRVAGRQEQVAPEQVAPEQVAPEQAPPAAPAEPDYAAEIEKLAQLKSQGLISDEEFEAKKKQILGI